MRLYLSSYKFGNREKLVELVGPGKRAVLILNALDGKQESRDRFLTSQTEELRKLNFIVEELDLRNYFNKQEELETLLKEKDLVWINGGNTFVLRRAMKQSGFDTIIKKLIGQDAIVYGGFSAATCVAANDLHGLDIVDDPNIIPPGYDKDIIWDGLGFIDFSVAVHYKSGHPESHLTDQEVEYYKSHNRPYKTLRDGEAVVVYDDSIEKF